MPSGNLLLIFDIDNIKGLYVFVCQNSKQKEKEQRMSGISAVWDLVMSI